MSISRAVFLRRGEIETDAREITLSSGPQPQRPFVDGWGGSGGFGGWAGLGVGAGDISRAAYISKEGVGPPRPPPYFRGDKPAEFPDAPHFAMAYKVPHSVAVFALK